MRDGSVALDEVVTQEIRHKITQRLRDIFGDDDVSVLTDYICHMINHNQTKEHITNELKEFLADEAIQFGEWVNQLVSSACNTKKQANASAGKSTGSTCKSSNTNLNSGALGAVKTPYVDSSTQGNNGNKQVAYSDQGKDSLDTAISNAIKSGGGGSATGKTGFGRQKQYSFQTGIRSESSRGGQHYGGTNFSATQDFTGGPLIHVGSSNKQTRVNYRNTPYMKTGTFSGSGNFPSAMPSIGIGNTSSLATHPTVNKVKIRCKNWPNCDKGDNCFYIHPSEACKAWPLCTYGPGCFYIHPAVPCRFGLACYNSICNYSHPIGWDPYHNEVPIFKYGGYKNSSLIIENSNQSSNPNNRPVNSVNTFQVVNREEARNASMNIEAVTGFNSSGMSDSIHCEMDGGTGVLASTIKSSNIQL